VLRELEPRVTEARQEPVDRLAEALDELFLRAALPGEVRHDREHTGPGTALHRSGEALGDGAAAPDDDDLQARADRAQELDRGAKGRKRTLGARPGAGEAGSKPISSHG
jgi:hypothetical protein